MTHMSRDSSYTKDNERIDYHGQISAEYQFERPAIDQLLDYISNQECQKPAIDILIQEYLERIGCPSAYQPSPIPTLMDINTDNGNDNKSLTGQSTYTPTRTMQNYQFTSTFYPTPLTSSNDIMYDSNYDYRNSASTPLLPPSSARSNRSLSLINDGIASTSSTCTPISSNQEISAVDRFTKTSISQDNRLKRAAAEERRQATRHFGKVQPGLIWTAPLPVRPRIFSIRPPALSCKIFLGGIPHDLNSRDLQERLEMFGTVRLEWPNKDNAPMHKSSPNYITAGFVYAIYDNEESVHKILHTCSTKTDRTLDDGRCEYYLDVYSQRSNLRRKSIQIIPWFVEDSQWLAEGEYSTNGYANWEQRLNSTECINRTVFVGALHGMMTAYALARICHELFGDVEYAAIDTDRNKYPIGSGRVIFVNAHSYYAAVTANYLMIECDKFCKVIQIDPYVSDNVPCTGVNGQWCPNMGQYFCRSLKCMKYYCATCWDLNPSHSAPQTNEFEPPAMIHKPLMRNARTT